MTEFKSTAKLYGEVTTPFNQNNQRWDHPIGEKLKKQVNGEFIQCATFHSINFSFLILVTTNTFKIIVLTK